MPLYRKGQNTARPGAGYSQGPPGTETFVLGMPLWWNQRSRRERPGGLGIWGTLFRMGCRESARRLPRFNLAGVLEFCDWGANSWN